jgi:hypothetical protein
MFRNGSATQFDRFIHAHHIIDLMKPYLASYEFFKDIPVHGDVIGFMG